VRDVAGHCRGDAEFDLDRAGLADPGTTLVVSLGAGNIVQISREPMAHGLTPEMPVMCGQQRHPRTRRLISTLGLAADTARAGFPGPVLFVVGAVVSLYPARPSGGLDDLAVPAHPATAEPPHA